MLTVHRSATTEPLVDRLADRLWDDPPKDWWEPVEIAVQSRGMERWLAHQLAERLGPDRAGVCANVAFPFPGKVVTRVAAAAVGHRDEDDPWSPERLVLALLDALPALLDDPRFSRLARYLGGGRASVDRRRWMLARELADLFDRYALYRPGMVAAWGRGDDVGPDGPLPAAQRWQPELWRALVARVPGEDPASRHDRALAALRDGRLAEPDRMPGRITLFGISALPPRHVALLHAAAEHVAVELYVLTPSPARWERTTGTARADAAHADTGTARGDGAPVGDRVPAHATTGDAAPATHPLLTSCARLVDDLATVLADLDHVDAPLPAPPAPPAAPRLLDVLQADLHADRDRGAPEDADATHPLAPDDTSVQVHACHGPARQVEVLRDVLLGLLADDPSLEPRDVLVMTPDVEAYAPLIGAVFADTDDDAPTLPVRIADRSLRGTNPVAEVLLDLCALAEGRVTASAVLDLIGAAPVAGRFRFTTEELTRITGWVRDSGVRWGVDEHDRAAAGQPAERIHTWRFGLDRLLSGVAVADEDDRLVGDVVPFDDVEGQDVELLGRLADAVGAVFDLRRGLTEPRTLPAWADALADALERLIEIDDADRWRVHELRAGLDDLAALPDAAGAQPVLELGAVRVLLEQAVDAGRGAAGYETGAATVCAMVPMRSIPHRVVCLLGADDDVFPRVARRRGFDLLAARRHVGDRDRRDEDRFLFLEALLAARDHLVVTFTGRDPRTNEPRAPAVPVAELLDVLGRSARVTDAGEAGPGDGVDAADAGDARDDGPDPAAVRARLVTHQPLQPFAPAAFRTDAGRAPRGFDRAHLAGARALQGAADAVRPFLADRLPPPDEEDLAVVRVGELARFLAHPTRVLLEQRLGLRLREDVTLVSDAEPIDLDNLARYQVGAALLEASVQGRDRDAWSEATLARGTVPAGAFGRREIAVVATTVDAVLEEAADLLSEPADEVAVDLMLDGRRLQGLVGGIRGGTRLVLQYATVRPKHALDLWVHHLALAAAGHAGLSSRLAGREGSRASVVELGPLDDDPDRAAALARDHLGRLLRLHADGLTRPLPLFESTSARYADRAMQDDEHAHEAGLVAARRAWESDGFSGAPGDRDDPYVAQVFGEEADLAEVAARTDFAELALAVYRPLREHQDA